MKISISVEINETESVFNDLFDTEKLSIDIAYTKYKFDLLKDEQEKRLFYIAIEISQQKKDVLVGNVCFNLREVLYLNRELEKYKLSLDTVYIPSDERLEQRKKIAHEEHVKWNRLLGTSHEEIERNFFAFKERLQEIRNGLNNTTIQVKAV